MKRAHTEMTKECIRKVIKYEVSKVPFFFCPVGKENSKSKISFTRYYSGLSLSSIHSEKGRASYATALIY
jgi:hypothetical protein